MEVLFQNVKQWLAGREFLFKTPIRAKVSFHKVKKCKKVVRFKFKCLLVMGVKGSRVKQIEELSGTVISFQKNPTPTGALTSVTTDSTEVTAQTASNKVRELTILGASHQAIEHAKHLIYTTIQRNISPTRSQHTDELSAAIGSIDSRLTKLNAEVFTLYDF